jgi:hypothetical protein
MNKRLQFYRLTQTPDEFRLWLEGRPDGTVGVSCTARSCPVATFLKEQIDVPDVAVRSREISAGPYFRKTPPWIEAFTTRLDKSGCDYINGSKALAVLAEVAA